MCQHALISSSTVLVAECLVSVEFFFQVAVREDILSGGFGGGGRAPYGPKFSQFHAVFRKIWQNYMLAPPLESWRPLLRGILDPAL